MGNDPGMFRNKKDFFKFVAWNAVALLVVVIIVIAAIKLI